MSKRAAASRKKTNCAAVVLARRFGTRRLLSFDERRFRTVSPLQSGAFELLPTDA